MFPDFDTSEVEMVVSEQEVLGQGIPPNNSNRICRLDVSVIIGSLLLKSPANNHRTISPSHRHSLDKIHTKKYGTSTSNCHKQSQ
jgi:hypothetical protein